MNLELTLFQEIVVVLFWMLIGGFCAYTAKLRGRDPLSWFFIGVIFGFFGLIALLVMPPYKKAAEEIEAPSRGEAPPSLKDKLWYYFDVERNQVGPVRFDELVTGWDSGSISDETYVWSEGFADWVKIRDQQELYAFLHTEP